MTGQHITHNLPHLIELAGDVEKRLEGVDVSVVDGVVMMSPVAPVHFRTRREIDVQLREQVGDAALGEIEFDHPEWDQKRSPDLIVWHGDEEDPAPYDGEAIELAVEIVSPSSVENDYVLKPHAYAVAGIPASLVLDPCTRTWTLFTDPAPRRLPGTRFRPLRQDDHHRSGRAHSECRHRAAASCQGVAAAGRVARAPHFRRLLRPTHWGQGLPRDAKGCQSWLPEGAVPVSAPEEPRGKDTSTRRFFLRPCSEPLSAIG